MGAESIEYNGLQFVCNGEENLRGKARIYFCCAKEDFASCFEDISKELLKVQHNAAIWYYDPANGIPDCEQFWDDLSQMQLFVVTLQSGMMNT